MRLVRPNQFQLRLGWLRVLAGYPGTADPSSLESYLLGFSQTQGDWLASFSSSPGKVSRRAAPELVLMGEAYHIYDRELNAIVGNGLALAALDGRGYRGSNPMNWDLAIGSLGLRICLESNGDVLFPLLRRWPGPDGFVALVRDIYQSLRERQGGPRDDTIESALHRLGAGERAWYEVLRPLVEPLRELGLFTPEGRNYRLTPRGQRLQEELRGSADLEILLNAALIHAWAHACELSTVQAQPSDLPALLGELPGSLQGSSPTSAPVAVLLSWLQVRLLDLDPPRILEGSVLREWIQDIASRAEGRISLRPGLIVGRPEFHWTGPSLQDDALWRTRTGEISVDVHSAELEGPDTPIAPEVRAPSASAPVPPPSSPPLPPSAAAKATKKPSSLIPAWRDWVLSLLSNHEGTAHGGPETWLRHLGTELESGSPERLERRRREVGFRRDFDNQGNHRLFEKIWTAPLYEVERLLPGESRARWLADLRRHSSVDGRSAREDLGLVALALAGLPELRAAAVAQISTFLAGNTVGNYAEEGDRAFRLTRWLVEDALFCGEWSGEQLASHLGSEPSLQAAQDFLRIVSEPQQTPWNISLSLSIASGSPPLQRLLSLLEPEMQAPLWSRTLPQTSLPSRAAAEALGQQHLDELIARLDFALHRSHAKLADALDSRPEVTRADLVEPESAPHGQSEPPLERDPSYWGFYQKPDPSRLLHQPAPLGRALTMLRASRKADRASQRVAQLWVSIEQLVSSDTEAKGAEVVRVFSHAGALVALATEAGRIARRALAALHRLTFEAAHRGRALPQWEIWLSKDVRTQYANVAEKLCLPREKLFPEEPLSIGDKFALVRIAECSHADQNEDPKGRRVRNLAELVAIDDPLCSWQLGILAHRLSTPDRFRRHYRDTRLEIAALLSTAYDVRNRLLHAGEVGARHSDPLLEALYGRLRRVVDDVLWRLMGPSFARMPSVAVRWAAIDALGARLIEESSVEGGYPRLLAASIPED